MMLEGNIYRRKSHQGLSDMKTTAITSQGGAGMGSTAVQLCPLLQILLRHQPMATALLLEAGQQVGQASCLSMSELSGFSHHDPDRWAERVPKCHLTPWRGQSARPAWSHFPLLAYLVAWCFHVQWAFQRQGCDFALPSPIDPPRVQKSLPVSCFWVN